MSGDPNNTNNDNSSPFLGTTHSMIHDSLNAFQNTLKQRKNELEELRKQEHKRLIELQSRIAKIDVELKETNHWLKKLESDGNEKDVTKTSDTTQPISDNNEDNNAPYVFGKTEVPIFETNNNETSTNYQTTNSSNNNAGNNVKEEGDKNSMKQNDNDDPLQVDLAPNTQFLVDKMSDLMVVSVQELEQMKMNIHDLTHNVKELTSLQRSLHGNSNNKFQTLLNHLDKIYDSNKNIGMLIEAQKAEKSYDTLIAPLLSNLKDNVKLYTIIDTIVRSWVQSMCQGETVDLKPIICCRGGGTYASFGKACLVLEAVLKTLGFSKQSKIVNLEYQIPDVMNAETARRYFNKFMDNARGGVAALTNLFGGILSSDVLYIENVFERAKNEDFLLVIYEYEIAEHNSTRYRRFFDNSRMIKL